MDTAVAISSINDFLFCPRSLYLHNIYSSFDTITYHGMPQVKGCLAHENIESGKYTTSSYVLQGLSVYCERLGVKGKIDIYDADKKFLVERKYRVKSIYTGFKYQLWAQMYCLAETGLPVKRLFIHSLSNNLRYEISLPTEADKRDLEETIRRIRLFDVAALRRHSCNRCQNNIYSLLNW